MAPGCFAPNHRSMGRKNCSCSPGYFGINCQINCKYILFAYFIFVVVGYKGKGTRFLVLYPQIWLKCNESFAFGYEPRTPFSKKANIFIPIQTL